VQIKAVPFDKDIGKSTPKTVMMVKPARERGRRRRKVGG